MGGGGWGNGEQQIYTDSPVNSFAQDGLLHVKLVKDSVTGTWTSARLKTSASFSFAQGKVEARVRLQDAVPGVFPAVWMLGKKITQGTSWPKCGEIDLFEFQSGWWSSHTVPSSLHFQERYGANAVSFANTQIDPSQWHLYQLEWTDNLITFSHDGKKLGTYLRPATPTVNNWPFTPDNPFFLIINHAISPSGGSVPQSSLQEATLLVDYIQVSQL